eukprot:PhM_4_TR18024/c1_g3_i4/m.93149
MVYMLQQNIALGSRYPMLVGDPSWIKSNERLIGRLYMQHQRKSGASAPQMAAMKQAFEEAGTTCVFRRKRRAYCSLTTSISPLQIDIRCGDLIIRSSSIQSTRRSGSSASCSTQSSHSGIMPTRSCVTSADVCISSPLSRVR